MKRKGVPGPNITGSAVMSSLRTRAERPFRGIPVEAQAGCKILPGPSSGRPSSWSRVPRHDRVIASQTAMDSRLMWGRSPFVVSPSTGSGQACRTMSGRLPSTPFESLRTNGSRFSYAISHSQGPRCHYPETWLRFVSERCNCAKIPLEHGYKYHQGGFRWLP